MPPRDLVTGTMSPQRRTANAFAAGGKHGLTVWQAHAPMAARPEARACPAASARAHGNVAAVAAEGALLDPAAALPNPHLPPGDYACRVIKLGTPAGSTLAYVAYPRFRCRVAAEQDIFSFTKITGSQRQVGLIFDDNDRRKIFLGTLMLGDETRALDYGADAERNLAGLVERIGPNRWRIVFPRPAFESMIDVMELVPEA